MQALIRRAETIDLERLKGFLSRANLGTDGITIDTIDSFLVLEDENNEIKGSLGMEVFPGLGLLRSLVVSPGQAEQEIIVLFDQMVQFAKEKGIHSLFLATKKSTTVKFFELIGFQQIRQEDLPAAFYDSAHIQHILNVDNSLFLKLSV